MTKRLSTRRAFLQRGLSLLALAPTIPTFLDQTVLALEARGDAPAGRRAADHPILIVIQLSGGNDGLNAVVPFADDAYYRARPTLAVSRSSVLKLDDYAGLNPKAAGLKSLFDDGSLAVLQGAGYPNPNRSHFRSMDIWHTARPDEAQSTTGWIGRYFDNACSGADPDVGVAIGRSLPLAMQANRLRPLSIDRPESYRYPGRERELYESLLPDPRSSAASRAEPSATDDATALGQLRFLERTALDAQVSSDEILRSTRGHRASSAYRADPFSLSLRTIAAMIAGGLPTRIYYASLGGFDTHAAQRGRHDQLLEQLAGGLRAFWNDLVAQGNASRVLVMTFSEFGRRVAQNGSGGTDHGAAAPMFLIGDRIAQGVIGAHPSLTDLDRGDLKHTLDFRRVYATILDQWLKADSAAILGQKFEPLPLFRRA